MSTDATTIQVAESTRHAFFSGLSAAEWGARNRDLYAESFLTSGGVVQVGEVICETVISLLGSFHGNRDLREYLRFSVIDTVIPVQLHQLLAVFLRNARPPNIHDPSTLDMICRLILTLHYDSSLPPGGSLIPFSISPTQLLSIISDALSLLRLSYEFTVSPFHQLSSSASELVNLLLTCVGDISNASTTQVSILLSQVHELLQVNPLEPGIRHALDSFLLVLSLAFGDGSRQVEEAEIFSNFQLTPRPDSNDPNPSLDLLTGAMIMNRLVSDRALPSGSGTENIAIANLIAWFRISSQSQSIFYGHVLLSVVACLGQTPVELDGNRHYLWKSFLLGRIPILLRKLQERFLLEAGSEVDHSDSVMQSAVAQVFTHHDLLDQCDIKPRTPASMPTSTDEDDAKGSSIRSELLISLMMAKLLDHKFSIELVANVPSNTHTKFSVYAQESGSDIDTFVDSKFSADVNLEDMLSFVDRVMRDVHSHAPFTVVLHSRFIHACQTHDIERLGRICKVLIEHDNLLEILTLHTPLYEIIGHSLACLQDFDLTTVGDPQTAVTRIGEVVLFLQSTLARYRVHSSTFHVNGRSLSAAQIMQCSIIYPTDTLSQADQSVLEAWRKAIFDPRSEGIDDDILRSTKHQLLLSLSATLFFEAVDACILNRLDAESLQNGLSYYMSPLLNWTLVGVVQALLDEVERLSFQSPQHIKCLETILSHKDCPRTVLHITRQQILRLYSDPKARTSTDTLPNMNELVGNVLKVSPPTSQNIKEQGAWLHEPRNIVRHALASADAGKLPTFDIARCLSMTNVRTFFDFAWREMLAAASIGKIEICRRFATVLLAPTSGTSMESCTPSVPPLLPLFLHAYIPSLLVWIDNQPSTSDQNLSVQLLAAIVVSALTFAAHFERALLSSSTMTTEGGVKGPIPCSAMVRKLRIDLRKLKGWSALQLFQKLSTSSTFVSTFPTL